MLQGQLIQLKPSPCQTEWHHWEPLNMDRESNKADCDHASAISGRMHVARTYLLQPPTLAQTI